MTEMEKLFRTIVGIIAETDSQNNDKAIKIFLEFHSYLLDNSSAYLEDDYGVDFNDIINVLETLDKPETGTRTLHRCPLRCYNTLTNTNTL